MECRSRLLISSDNRGFADNSALRNGEKSLTSKVELDDVEVSDDHGRLRGRLLVIIKPFTPKSLRLIPHFQQVFVVLHNHCVLVKLSVEIGFGPASSVCNSKREKRPSRRRSNVHAPRVTVLTLGKHYSLERMGERKVNVHVVLSAHHFQRLDLRHAFGPLQRPDVSATAAAAGRDASHLKGSRNNESAATIRKVQILR